MAPNTEQLLQAALKLPDNERGELAARLIESLEPTAEEDAESAWGMEIRQRIEELDRGTVQPIPWAEARRMILDDNDDAGER